MRATDLIGQSLYQEGKMITRSGVLFDLLNPSSEFIVTEDISGGLSRAARWNGGTRNFYSVAEHCCRCFDRAPVEMRLTALLHDAEEAYWGDVISTVKSILKRTSPEVVEKMKSLLQIILEKYGAPTDEETMATVKRIDEEELQRDFDELIIGSRRTWTPSRAEHEFLHRFHKVTNHNNI